MKSWNLFLTVAAAMLFVASAADAQQSACSLLTPSDIEVPTGAKAGAGDPSDYSMPVSPTKSEPVRACSWDAGTRQSRLVISIIGRLSADVSAVAAAEAAKNMAKQSVGKDMDTLRAKHWTVEEKDFGKSWCLTLTPPASEKGLMLSSCTAGVKGMILTFTFTSPTKTLSIAQTKTLLDKAIGRLR